jgi:tRNA dimethylallyltransferase
LKPVLVVAGPTASGKTELAIEIARRLGGEIISADSRQVYRGLDIGTAKPTPAQRETVCHHLLDLVDPGERYNAGRFAREASEVIERLDSQGRTPIVCGGTGFYIEALFSPLFEEPVATEAQKLEIRERLKEKAESQGTAALHRELAAVDPESAARLHPNDFQRVSRALEIYLLSGRSLTGHLSAAQKKSPWSPFTVLLDPPRERLRESIGCRSRSMLDRGWPEEVERLLASGLPETAPGFQSLGYRTVIALVRGELSGQEALERIDRETWQYARRQRTWFNNRPAGLRLEGMPESLEGLVALWNSFADELRRG